MAHARAHAQALADDLDQAGGAELARLGEVQHAVPRTIELAPKLTQQRGLAGAGLAGQHRVGLVEFDERVREVVLGADEVGEGKRGSIHGYSWSLVGSPPSA